MNAVLTDDGKIAIPEKLKQEAQLKPGDKLDVHLYKGTLVLRKHEPLSPDQCAELLEHSRSQPPPQAADHKAVSEAIQEVRARRR